MSELEDEERTSLERSICILDTVARQLNPCEVRRHIQMLFASNQEQEFDSTLGSQHSKPLYMI
eukprot:6931191-Pyramimonas_sp.AAC.1